MCTASTTISRVTDRLILLGGVLKALTMTCKYHTLAIALWATLVAAISTVVVVVKPPNTATEPDAVLIRRAELLLDSNRSVNLCDHPYQYACGDYIARAANHRGTLYDMAVYNLNRIGEFAGFDTAPEVDVFVEWVEVSEETAGYYVFVGAPPYNLSTGLPPWAPDYVSLDDRPIFVGQPTPRDPLTITEACGNLMTSRFDRFADTRGVAELAERVRGLFVDYLNRIGAPTSFKRNAIKRVR